MRVKTERYDFAVIGAGSAGLIGAGFACKLGARVALIERERIGGDCTWSGCVPSKSLLRVAKAAHEVRTAARFGITSTAPGVDMPAVREYVRSTIAQIYAGTTPDALRRKGIGVVLGATTFIDRRTLAVGDKRIRARKILIATGAQPVIPAIPGLDDVAFFTYRTIFENDRLPNEMVVIGGGPVGVEVAQAYGRLGARVTLFAERVLPKEEPEAARIVERVLQAEGIRIVGERAVSVERSAGRIVVRSQTTEAGCDLLFVAVGRRPALDGLHLEAAGVKYSAHGIDVNERLQTSTKTIYAAGDVIGGAQFSHLAGWQGFQAARNALLPASRSAARAALPRVTFCDPEVAQVGRTEAEARTSNGTDVVVAAWPIEREDRAVCDDDRDGVLKFITKRDGTLLGATIVGHRAGEAIAEVALALEQKLRIGDIAGTIHAYPTYSTGVQLVASELTVQGALRGISGRLIRVISRLTR